MKKWNRAFIVENTLGAIRNLLIILGIALLFYFIVPDFLYRETEEAVISLYEKADTDHYDGHMEVCNLKRGIGPVFGALYVDSCKITFIPFKSTLQDNHFVINHKDIVDVELTGKKMVIFDKLLGQNFSQFINISYKDKILILQSSNPKYTMEIMNKN